MNCARDAYARDREEAFAARRVDARVIAKGCDDGTQREDEEPRTDEIGNDSENARH